MFVVLGQSALNSKLNEISPQINCVEKDPTPYTEANAIADAALGENGMGVLYCYCKNEMFALIDKTDLSLDDIIA